MTITTIVLADADELALLPERASADELFSRSGEDGRTMVLPGSQRRASAWCTTTVREPGGQHRPSWWESDPIVESSPVQIFRLTDAYYAPRLGIVISASGEVMRTTAAEARYWTPDLAKLPHARREADHTILNVPSDVPTLDRIAVTMPWGALHNYGHFLLDCMPAVALLLDLDSFQDYTFVFPPVNSWQRRHLELVGVTQISELTSPLYLVSDVVFTSCMAGFLHRPNLNYRTLRRRQLQWVNRAGSASSKIYLSRRHIQKRPFVSEEYLEMILRSRDYLILNPETFSVDEQLAIFSSAELVVGCAGAAFANLIYCGPGTTAIEITPSRMVEPIPIGGRWVRNICALMECNWRPYYSSMIIPETFSEAGRGHKAEQGFAFDVDTDDLLQYVDSCM